MLNMITSAEAAQRPLAGFGMGAYRCDGVQVGASPGAAVPAAGAAKGIDTAAALALPRVKRTVVLISESQAPAGTSGAGYQVSILAKAEQFTAQQFEHMTRVRPVVPGGVGPHPAREPEPV